MRRYEAVAATTTASFVNTRAAGSARNQVRQATGTIAAADILAASAALFRAAPRNEASPVARAAPSHWPTTVAVPTAKPILGGKGQRRRSAGKAGVCRE